MSSLETTGFASVCQVRHWSLAQKINDLFLTVFEDDSGKLFCAGTWDREHSGSSISLTGIKSVLIPVIDRVKKQVSYTALDLELLDAVYRDYEGKIIDDANQASTVHSQVYVPCFLPDILRIFIMNAEGKQVLPGYTELAEAEVPYDIAKNIHEGAKSYVAPVQEQRFERREPEFFDSEFPGWENYTAQSVITSGETRLKV